MTAAAAAAPLDEVRLRRLRKRVGQLRELLGEALHLIGEVYESDDWRLVASSWEEFCAAELPELAQLRLEPEQRRAVIVDLAGRGLSQRGIGAPLGLSAQTVMRELKAAGVVRDKVKSRDGSIRPATAAPITSPRPRIRRTDRVVELVAGAGPDGLSVRDVARSLRWSQHIAAATLCRLVASGRIAYVPPARRGLFGTYVGSAMVVTPATGAVTP